MPIPMTLGKLTLPCSMQPERQHEVSKKYWSNTNRNIGAKTSAAVSRQSLWRESLQGTNKGRDIESVRHQCDLDIGGCCIKAKFPKYGSFQAVSRLSQAAYLAAV